MRKFIVLGFASKSTDEVGEVVHLGTDRGEAIAAVNQPMGERARLELYELATPEKRRFAESAKKTAKSKSKAKKTSKES